MNYLFNLFLVEQLLIKDQKLGVLIADCIKYSRKKNYDPLVEKGIAYQIKMDEFIKNHPSFNDTKKRIDPKFTRFANEVVKLYYNHFLVTYWNQYSEFDLPVSVSNAYLDLTFSWEHTPQKLHKLIPILVSSPGIVQLKTIGGMHSFIDAVSRKGLCVAFLQNSLLDLSNNYHSIKEDFKIFMKDLQQFVINIDKEEENKESSYVLLANAS
jgi:acyl carrier protein phosphodiesterase